MPGVCTAARLVAHSAFFLQTEHLAMQVCSQGRDLCQSLHPAHQVSEQGCTGGVEASQVRQAWAGVLQRVAGHCLCKVLALCKQCVCLLASSASGLAAAARQVPARCADDSVAGCHCHAASCQAHALAAAQQDHDELLACSWLPAAHAQLRATVPAGSTEFRNAPRGSGMQWAAGCRHSWCWSCCSRLWTSCIP